jgi:hypothetical protein
MNQSVVLGSRIGLTMYIVHESELQIISHKCLQSNTLMILKFWFLKLQMSEFENIKKWVCDNKMITNLSKAKEIVFHNPNPSCSLYPNPPSLCRSSS